MSHNRHNYRSAGGNIATSGECSGVNKKIIACIKQGQPIQQRGCNKPFHLCSPVVPKGCQFLEFFQKHPDSVPAMVAYLKNRFHSMARKKLVSLFLTGGITCTRKLGAHSESRAKHTCRRSAGFRRTQIIDFSRGYVFSPDPHFENNYSGRPALSIVTRQYKSTQTMPWNHGTGMGINITHVGPAGSTT